MISSLASAGEGSLSCESTQPGPMWLTRMPCGASSIAIDSQSARIPDFVAP